ncbi:hypothetical protein [Desulfacinum hydrothermale]|uniref:hypothetical protein n=1 Tax=Desulfacinum hydrothermale TaxID=109258 RepID=UPI00111C68D5|nr:hypothetical protein [Desulfacinum hydrothermale]
MLEHDIVLPMLGARLSWLMFAGRNIPPHSWSAFDRRIGAVYRTTLHSRYFRNKKQNKEDDSSKNGDNGRAAISRPIGSIVIERVDKETGDEKYTIYLNVVDIMRLRGWCTTMMPDQDMFGAFIVRHDGCLALKAGGGPYVEVEPETLAEFAGVVTRCAMGRSVRYFSRSIRILYNGDSQNTQKPLVNFGGISVRTDPTDLHRLLMHLERAMLNTPSSMFPLPEAAPEQTETDVQTN